MFVFGGEYENLEPSDKDEQQTRPAFHFGMVHPAHRGQPIMPYVYEDEDEARRMWRLTEHHSHLYKVSDDLTTVTLVGRSGWCSIGAPTPVALNEENQTRLRQAIGDKG